MGSNASQTKVTLPFYMLNYSCILTASYTYDLYLKSGVKVSKETVVLRR